MKNDRSTRKLRRPYPRLSWIFTVWLLAVWLALFGAVTWTLVLGGLVAAIVIQWLFPLPHQSGTWQLRPLSLIVLVVRFLWDVVRAGLHVAALVLFSRSREDMVIGCTVRSVNPVYLAVLVAMTSLIPGTIVMQIDRRSKRIYLHVLDSQFQGGATGVRAATSAQEARILRAIAPKAVLQETGLLTGKGSNGNSH